MSFFVFCSDALTTCCVRVYLFDCLQEGRKFFTKLADDITYMTYTKNKNKKVTAVTYERRKIHVVILFTTGKKLFSVKKYYGPNTLHLIAKLKHIFLEPKKLVKQRFINVFKIIKSSKKYDNSVRCRRILYLVNYTCCCKAMFAGKIQSAT